MTLKSWLQLLLLSVLWGGSFFFIEIALVDLPIFTIVFLRVFTGSLLLLLFLKLKGAKLPKERSIWLRFFIMGLLNNVIPFTLIVSSQTFIDSSFASILNATTPFLTIIVAHILTSDESLTVNKIAGASLGLTGVIVLIGYKSMFSGNNELIGGVLMFLATLSYSFAGVYGKSFRKFQLNPVIIATGQLISSTIILFPLVITIDKPWDIPLPGYQSILAIVGIALFSTAIAYIIYFNILTKHGATNVLLVTLLIPVSAILLGVFILSEPFQVQYIGGISIISLGLLLIDGRVIKRFYGRR